MRPQRPQLFGKTLFVDLMMSTLVVITSLLMASNAIEKAKKTEPNENNLKTDGLYAIVLEWPDDSADDVDIYVRDPRGRIIYFASRDVGLSHLEHDDQGTVSDRTQGGGKKDVAVQRNEERVIIRGIFPGEFIVNAHMFDKRGSAETPVTVSLYYLKGEDGVVIKREHVLPQDGSEVTAFRFTVKEDGTPGETNELSHDLVGHTPRGGR